MKAIVGALRVVLGMDSAAFERGANASEKRAGALQKRMASLSKTVTKFGKRMSIGVTAPLTGLATAALKSSMATVDAQSKMAQSLGTSTRSMQVLARAADRAGVSQGELEQISRQLTKRLSQAATGAGPAAKALKRLGLSVSDLQGMDLDQRIAAINAAIAEHIPLSEQAAVAASIFGDRAGLIASRMDAATINAASEEMEKFGITVSEIEADQIEEANDAISSISLLMTGLGNRLAVSLAPVLKDIAEGLANLGGWFFKLTPQQQRFAGAAAAIAAAIGPLAIGLGFVVTAIGALLSPIGLAIGVFVVLAGVITAIAVKWDELVKRFPVIEKLADLGKALGRAWSSLPAIKWALLIPALRWARFIPGLRWLSFIPTLRWAAMVPNIAWAAVAGKLSWRLLIIPLKWTTRFIPVIGWAVLAGELLWRLLIKPLGWDEFIKKIDWSRFVPSIDWSAVFDQSTHRTSRMADRKMRETGEAISEGLAEGISAGQPGVAAAAENAAEAAVNAAKDATGVRSPSTVFRDIGQFLMEGLSLGIGNGLPGALKAMNAASEGIAEAMKGGVTGADAFKSVKESVESFGQATESVFNKAGRWLVDLAKGATTLGETFRKMAQNFANMLGQTGMQGLTSSLTGSFGSGWGGFLSGIVGGLLGFANGGEFKVGGAGGIDSQIVAFRASPDETVTVRRPDQSMQQGGGVMRIELAASEDLKLVAAEAGANVAVQVVDTRLGRFAQSQRRPGL